MMMRILIFLVCFPAIAEAQDVDKKSFCKDLNKIVTVFSQSADSLKGKFNGENTLGVQQWEAKYSLSGAGVKFYEHTFLETSEEYRATYIMMENKQKEEAEDSYKQIVAAVRWCYGVDYFLNEQVTTEWDNSGKKHQHHEATFTYAGITDKGVVMPVMLVRSFSIESGLYSVTFELYTISSQ